MDHERLALRAWNRRMTEMKREGRCEDVVDVLHRLCSDPDYPFPDRVSFNIAIDALGRASRHDLMEETFRRMLEDGHRPDVRTFTSMLHSYARSDFQAFASTYDLMRRMGVTPNERTWSACNLIKNSKSLVQSGIAFSSS